MGKYGNVTLKQLVNFVEKAVEEFVGLPNYSGSGEKGGYFCLMRNDGRIILVIQIGKYPFSELYARKCYFLCQEKAERLCLLIPKGDISSWQSRDSDKARWGGAVLGEEYILSFSGLPELGDEAVMLVTAYRLGFADVKRINAIKKKSRNPYFEALNGKMYMKVPEVFGLPEHLCPSVWGGRKL